MAAGDENYLVVLTTAGSEAEAAAIARGLVERRLAACVNIVPRIRSVYRWEGKIEDAEEWLLLAKTDEGHFDAARDAIQELHSYDVPEVIALPLCDGSALYLSWISASLE